MCQERNPARRPGGFQIRRASKPPYYRLSETNSFLFVTFATKHLVVTIIYCRFAAEFKK